MLEEAALLIRPDFLQFQANYLLETIAGGRREAGIIVVEEAVDIFDLAKMGLEMLVPLL